MAIYYFAFKNRCKMKTFAIIVTYNGMRWIDRCLQSLQKSTQDVSIIVIDNHSTDGLREYIPIQYPDVIWMPQQSNLGFGAANNIGIRYAIEHQADYILLLNQDASVEKDTIEKLIAQSDGISLLTPLHLNGDGTRLDVMFNEAIRKCCGELMDDLFLGKSLKTHYNVGEVCAACWMMPVALIKKIGLFNPLFYHYSEDNNYYQRMLYHHIGVTLVPEAKMYHDREIHGNKNAYNNKKLWRDILLLITDINSSIIVGFLRCLTLLASCYIKELPRHRYKPFQFSIAMLLVAFHLASIIKSRRIDRQGYSYL